MWSYTYVHVSYGTIYVCNFLSIIPVAARPGVFVLEVVIRRCIGGSDRLDVRELCNSVLGEARLLSRPGGKICEGAGEEVLYRLFTSKAVYLCLYRRASLPLYFHFWIVVMLESPYGVHLVRCASRAFAFSHHDHPPFPFPSGKIVLSFFRGFYSLVSASLPWGLQ